MSTKRIGTAYKAALRKHGIKQAAFAAAHGVTGPELTRVSQGQFPNDKILHALAHGWPDPKTGLEIIEAHLRDECDRAGIVKTIPRMEAVGASDSLKEDLGAIENFLRDHPDLSTALKSLADQLRRTAAKKTPSPQAGSKRISYRVKRSSHGG